MSMRSRLQNRRAGTLAQVVLAVAVTVGAAAGAGGCASRSGDFEDASVGPQGDGAAPGDDGGGGGPGLADGGLTLTQDAGPTIHDDFASPVFDDSDGGGLPVPSNAPALFGPAANGAAGGGPCLLEPESGALLPRNWLRPRVRWTPASGENLFELRIHAANQKSDLVVYTGATSWTMPQALWDNLRLDSNDVPMTLSIRGAVLSGGALTGIALGASIPIGVAPADAPGTIVYWTTADGTSLKGFQVGDESVGSTLVPSQIQQVAVNSTQCIGCHTGTPDGEYAVVSTNAINFGDVVALVDPDAGAVGATPPFLGAGALATLDDGPLGISTVSKAHWAPGDHVVVASDDVDLLWIDLEAADAGSARGVIARQGTPTGGSLPGAPTWSHDGKTIVYVATNVMIDGRLGGPLSSILPTDPGATADLFRVPYNGRQGGAISPVNGATDPNNEEFYPAYSPDDALLAFDKCPNGLSMYDQAEAELYVIPSDGGTATRLAANDPPACSGVSSPGVTNSWPKWAPSVTTTPDGRTFYWVVFSSKRFGSSPQLFVTGVVVSAAGSVTTHGSLYLWNQPASEGNHTPAWEYFAVPPPPAPMVVPQ
jgi:hypothetical protein